MKATSAKRRPLGLSERFILYLAGWGFLLSFLLIWNAALQQERTVHHAMERRGTQLAESLSSACGYRLYIGDRDGARLILESAAKIDDVVFIRIEDASGKDEIRAGKKLDPQKAKLPEPDKEKPAKNAAHSSGIAIARNQKYMVVTAPLAVEAKKRDAADLLGDGSVDLSAKPAGLEKAQVGTLTLVFTLQSSRRFVQTLILRSILATFLIVLLAGLSMYFTFRKAIIDPIRDMARSMTEAGQGHLEQAHVDVTRQDEIGQLGHAFNSMTSDLNRAEEALRRSNSELEEKVRLRTVELQKALDALKIAQFKMIRTERMAAIGKLASSVGHELRNPLGAIQNALYYIRDFIKEEKLTEKDPSLMEFLDLAEGEIKSSNSIISDLLDFSRVGKIFPQETDLHELLASMKSVVQIPENVRLEESLHPALPRIPIDPQKIRQVFINLATNAIQAMPKGGTLSIRTDLLDSVDPAMVVVEFKDQGAGMDAETLGKIFEPLFTTKAKGTGLGLAISNNIVEAHGGKISVSSEPGKGSVFTIRLPVKGAGDS